MMITAPITDYIPASVLTTLGDMVVRDAANPIRLGSQSIGRVLMYQGAGLQFTTFNMAGVLNHYLKSQGAGALPALEALALRDTGIYIGNGSRAANGDSVIAGVGFESSVVIFICMDNSAGNMNFSWGFDNGTVAMSMQQLDNGISSGISLTDSLFLQRAVGNKIVGHITTMGADGFTTTWVLTGACTTNYIYLCFP